MTGFTPETEACLACHPSQKDAGPLTDKAVDEVIARVRAYVEAAAWPDHTVLLRAYPTSQKPCPLIAGDLRALLSALELGSVANASREGSTEPTTPSDVELLRDQFALIGKLAGSGTLKQNGRPYPKWKAVSEEAEAGRAKADAMLSKGLKCAVCGSTKTDSEIEAGGWIACCPERRMVSALSASTTDSGRLDAEARLHVDEAMVERALHARVPGGSEVWCWLPQKDAWTPHQTARDVMECALNAALNASQAHVKHKAEGVGEPQPKDTK